MRSTNSITNWSKLALLLGITTADYERITKANNPTDVHQAVVNKWLESGKASWAVLVSALRDTLVNQGFLADEIAREHPKCELYIQQWTLTTTTSIPPL